MTEKSRLRAELRAERSAHVAALPQATRALVFMRPPSPVAALAPVGAVVGLYHATGSEAPAHAYARWFAENGRAVALPWFAAREEPMRFRRWLDPIADSDLAPGPFGFPQPQADAESVIPDLLIVPLLGFTAEGTRLGQGAGHYDRWLAGHHASRTVGLAWDCQLRPALPAEAHDVPLDAVVTPTRIFERSR